MVTKNKLKNGTFLMSSFREIFIYEDCGTWVLLTNYYTRKRSVLPSDTFEKLLKNRNWNVITNPENRTELNNTMRFSSRLIVK